MAESVPEALQQVMHGMAPHPAYLTNARWDVLAWNAPAALLFGDFAALPPADRNIAWLLFDHPVWRALFEDWQIIAESTAAQYRASVAALNDDGATQALIQRLQAVSEVFARVWAEQEVDRSPIRRKVLHHAHGGRLVFDYASFLPEGADRGLHLTVYTPADEDTASRFSKLLKA
jgi:hypothetical protein